MKNVRQAALFGSTAIALVALVSSESAFAQAPEPVTQDDEIVREADDAETIVVTGSRIRGIDPTGSPVVGLGREDIELSSASTTTELLSELPQLFNLGATDASFTSANNQNANRPAGTGIHLAASARNRR